MSRFTLLIPLLLTLTAVAGSAEEETADGQPVAISPHQDSFRLGRLASAVIPPDGLLAVGLGGRKYSTVYIIEDHLQRIGQWDLYLQAEASPVSWLHAWFELPYRSWSDGVGWIPPSGSGAGDVRWLVTTGTTLWSSRIHGAVVGGGNIPTGSRSAGLSEQVFSPRIAAALTFRFWTDAMLPEMRLHLNLGHRWNQAEDTGYGMGTEFLEPWHPRYPSAALAGGNNRNDTLNYGVAVEFRRATTALWIEYSADRFADTRFASTSEQFSALVAGLRWGMTEAWALHASYQVSLARDDLATDWQPAYPELVYELAVTRQFSIGGRDRDGDGIVDRKDRCPDTPEDLDGFQDDDGCPDYDNDGDGIADRYDGAPGAAEDYDGYQDHDGIPDPDNDGDGVLDRFDLCPDVPEDLDGHRDGDGCPDEIEDLDGDGVADEDDGCPEDPEDRDGYEDGDGCPESDNDLDGIPDEQDECPDEPEDYDGDTDDDGCPE